MPSLPRATSTTCWDDQVDAKHVSSCVTICSKRLEIRFWEALIPLDRIRYEERLRVKQRCSVMDSNKHLLHFHATRMALVLTMARFEPACFEDTRPQRDRGFRTHEGSNFQQPTRLVLLKVVDTHGSAQVADTHRHSHLGRSGCLQRLSQFLLRTHDHRPVRYPTPLFSCSSTGQGQRSACTFSFLLVAVSTLASNRIR